jgi:hypothetical protein
MRYDGFPVGMNNLASDHAMPDGALRNAVNVDIDRTGKLRLRKGYEKVHGGIDTHSGWSCELWTLFVQAGVLHKLNDDDTAEALMPVQGEVCYLYFNRVVYFSDGVKAYKLLDDGSIVNWGVAPLPAPQLAPTSGLLDKGRYMAAITPIGPDGVEHGASEIVTIDLAQNSGLIFTLPNVSDPQVEYLRLYLSTANGGVLYSVGDVAVGIAQITVTQLYDGLELDTVGVTNVPAGSGLALHSGVIYIRSGQYVYHTDPYAFDRFRPSRNYLAFPEEVSVIASVRTGLWIVADKTRFYAGADPRKVAPSDVAEYGAAPGDAIPIPDSTDVLWYSDRGVVRAGDGFLNLQDKNVATETGDHAAILLREQDGTKQVVASVRNTSVSPLVAQSFLEMEVIRKAEQ